MPGQSYVERFPNYWSLRDSFVQIVDQANCSSQDAFDAISSHCRAGLIQSRCKSFFTRYANSLGLLGEDIALPIWFWEETAG